MHIDTGAEMRGGQRQVILLLNALRAVGHESTLLAHDKSPLWRAGKADGFPVHSAAMMEIWRHSAKADLVHAHDARSHTLAALASRSRVVVSRRVAFPIKRSIASEWKYKRAARFLAVSEFVKRELASVGIAEDKVDVVYDGVQAGDVTGQWRPEFPAVALASRDPQKGRQLIEQAAGLARVPVVFSEALPQDLRQASMFLYITKSEGLGSAALLAMSMGIPVIASNVGGLPELFSDGSSGILVPNDPHEIAHGMRIILEQPEVAVRLIEHGRKRIEECFTLEHLLHRTLSSYARALAA